MERLELTAPQALNLHKTMWKEMQEELGDCPDTGKREFFKSNWCKKHFPDKYISHDCFLCEYIIQKGLSCKNCLVKWKPVCTGEIHYNSSPISTILALPIREEELFNG